MYSWGGGGGGAIYKQKYAYFMHRHITEAVRYGVLFIGGRKRRPEEIFKFRVSEMPFPGLWGSFDRMRMVRKKRFTVLVCRNLQFAYNL